MGSQLLPIGGKVDFITTCYVDSSGHYSKWIPAAGGLTNLAVGIGSLAFLRLRPHVYPMLGVLPDSRCRLQPVFCAVGYPAYSGIAQFGDWAAVINGLNPPWIWRVVLVAIAIGGYYASMRLLIDPMAPFAGVAEDEAAVLLAQARISRITLIPYIGSMVVACAAGFTQPERPNANSYVGTSRSRSSVWTYANGQPYQSAARTHV